jgi:replication-associated recombination protein RarA
MDSNPQMLGNNQRKNPQNQRGYYLYELLSALQKDIRRGKEYEAVFWAVELESFDPRTLWNRLRVIASEDISIANQIAPLVIDVLEKEYYTAYNPKKPEKDSYRLFLVHAVLFLARSRKSRIVDDLLNVVYGEMQHEDKKLPIPDYALDKHTERGKKMGRGFEYFFSEGNRLSNEAFENPYTERAKEILIKHGGLKPDIKKVTEPSGKQVKLITE